jgi:ribosomal 50S subunit-recycling heat shock protein
MNEGNKKKRGLKPRSQRNRKRPTLANDKLCFETEICRLEVDGVSVNVANPWIRIVKPYPYTFSTFAKARWNGRTVLDVYSSEFGSYPKSYYESAIAQGRIKISDQKVDLEYKIKGGDVLSHTVHRHEPAVAVSSQNGIDVIEETTDLVVVDKPGTSGKRVFSLLNIICLHSRFADRGRCQERCLFIHAVATT